MAQLRDKMGGLLSWARRNKKPVEVDIARVKPNSRLGREMTLQQLKEGYGEVVETMKAVRSHLDQQSTRNEQMLDLMKGIPEVLQSIPESNQRQTETLRVIQQNLERQNETAGHLTRAIVSLANASEKQGVALEGIHDRMHQEDASRRQLNEGVSELTSTLGGVQESNTATRASMQAVVEQTRINDERMRDMYQRSQRTTLMMVVLCLAVVVGALALGFFMLYAINNPGVLRPDASAPLVGPPRLHPATPS